MACEGERASINEQKTVLTELSRGNLNQIGILTVLFVEKYQVIHFI